MKSPMFSAGSLPSLRIISLGGRRWHRAVWSVALAVGISVWVGATTSACADELAKLQGAWRPVRAVVQGQELPGLRNSSLTIRGKSYQVKSGSVADEGTLAIDPSQDPAHMDIVGTAGPNQGKTLLALYKFEGARLVVAYRFEEETRPAGFESTATNQTFVITYERSSQDEG